MSMMVMVMVMLNVAHCEVDAHAHGSRDVQQLPHLARVAYLLLEIRPLGAIHERQRLSIAFWHHGSCTPQQDVGLAQPRPPLLSASPVVVADAVVPVRGKKLVRHLRELYRTSPEPCGLSAMRPDEQPQALSGRVLP
jgi:hypothetical protein